MTGGEYLWPLVHEIKDGSFGPFIFIIITMRSMTFTMYLIAPNISMLVKTRLLLASLSGDSEYPLPYAVVEKPTAMI